MMDPIELHALVDGELDPTDEKRVRELLRNCSASQAEIASIESVKSALQGHCHGIDCKKTWSACVARLDELDKAKRTEAFVGRYAWALCGVIFLFILAGGVSTRLRPGSDMSSSDLARAAASVGGFSRPTSQEPEQKRKWLDSLIGQASQLISPEGLQAVGGMTGQVDGHRVAQLALRDADGDLSLMLINAKLDLTALAVSPDPEYRTGKLQGINCVVWMRSGFTMVLAANRPYSDLIDSAKTIVIQR